MSRCRSLYQALAKGIGELVGVRQEATARPSRRPGRCRSARSVVSMHRGVPDRGVVRVGHRVRAGAVLRLPLLRAGRGSRRAPTRSRTGSRRSCCPRGRRGVSTHPRGRWWSCPALAAAVGVPSSPGPAPRAERPRARGRCTRPGRHRASCRTCGRRRCSDRLLVVHRHPTEGLPDVNGRRRPGRGCRWAPPGSRRSGPWHGAERTGELPVAAVALVPEPGVLRSPEDLLGLPGAPARSRSRTS